MAKTKLIFEPDFDFTMFAISCHYMDYRLGWHINRALNLGLKKEKDYELMGYKGKSDFFSFYKCHNSNKQVDFILISNKGVSSYLLPEQRSFDYFLLVEGYVDDIYKKRILFSLKGIEITLLTTELDPNLLPSKHNLIFE